MLAIKGQSKEREMNQIINMVMRIVMRKMLNKGIDAGFNKAASIGRNRKPQPQLDDYGNQPDGPTQQEVRAARRAKRQNKQGTAQAKQAMKVARRVGKL